MIFSIILSRTPKSVQAVWKEKYKEAIKDAAKARYSEAPAEGSVYIRITWFQGSKGGPDVDNIIKPILDALEGVIFENDSQISQCLATRIDLAKPYTISDRHISGDSFQELSYLLGSTPGDILYIEIGQMRSQQVIFGLIDGGIP